MTDLRDKLDVEGYENLLLLSDEYDDAFIGISDIGDTVAVYAADILDRITERDEWVEAWQELKDYKPRKCPMVIESLEDYKKFKISKALAGAVIGVTLDKHKIILSQDKLLTLLNMDEIGELRNRLSKTKNKVILIVNPIEGFDEIYNILSFKDYEMEEEIDEEDVYDDTDLLREIEKNVKINK